MRFLQQIELCGAYKKYKFIPLQLWGVRVMMNISMNMYALENERGEIGSSKGLSVSPYLF